MKPPSLSGAQAPVRRFASTRAERESQILQLPDGRALGYAEYGHPQGTPLVYFHGFPSSRLEGSAAYKLARRHRLRIIAPDRPGFGLSTFQPGRRIIDWPADISALADHLRLKRFSILGGSGGGPYALACAYSLPPERLTAVGVMAGAPPWEAGHHYMPWFARLGYFWAQNFPLGLKVISDALVGAARWAFTTAPVTQRIDAYIEQAAQKREGQPNSPKEREEESTTEERRERLIRVLLEGFAQGAGPFVQEMQLLTRNWGFKFEDIAYDRIQIWHGEKDVNSPVNMIRYMAARLPHVDLRVYPAVNHFAIEEYVEEILGELIPDLDPANTSIPS